MNKAIFKESIKSFLLNDITNLEQNVSKVDYETNLWDMGLVDSFRIMELILFLEDLLEKEISIENNCILNFHTIEMMYNKIALKEA